MNHIAPPHEPLIREVPLSRLALAPENVRKTPADPVAEAEMKASIATHGLLENLVVRIDGPADAGIYAVVAGGRRLAAMKALAEDGTIDPDHPVPCLVAADPDTAGELSLAENVVRIAMHPADQVIAFTKLADSGLSVAVIAARFGTSERLVEQRLRLGNVAPDLLDAYRADEIDLEVLKAFSVTTDHARQMAAWEQVAAQGYRPSAWQVKRLLTEERIPGTSAVARFVGVEAYEAGGGKVLRDLFSEEDDSAVWFDDPALLTDLAMEKLRVFKDELATRWKWAMSMVEVDWNTTARYGRIYPEPAERTPEEQAEIEKLEARQGVLAELDDDDWTEELVREAETIETRLDEIEGGIEARAVYKREDFGIAGCIATIARDGTLQVIDGLVRPEDMPKETAAESGAAQTGSGDGGSANTAGIETGTDTARIAGPAMSAPMTVKGQLAFEPQARPELEATVARLDIDFAKHVRPTADMLWSRIAKGRILDIARSVLSPAWASARSKNKKPDLAKAMEQAFAAGDPPLGLSAEMHAAALAWVPPGFAAFDTGRVDDEADDIATAEPGRGADATGQEPVAEAQAARAAPNAEGDGNGDSAPEPGPAAADDGADAEPADAPPLLMTVQRCAYLLH